MDRAKFMCDFLFSTCANTFSKKENIHDGDADDDGSIYTYMYIYIFNVEIAIHGEIIFSLIFLYSSLLYVFNVH